MQIRVDGGCSEGLITHPWSFLLIIGAMIRGKVDGGWRSGNRAHPARILIGLLSNVKVMAILLGGLFVGLTH